MGLPGRASKPSSGLGQPHGFSIAGFVLPPHTLCLGDSRSENPTRREKAKLPMLCRFLAESTLCSGFLPFCVKCYTGAKGGDGIKPEDERAGPQQIQSILVVIPVMLQVELGHAGSLKCDQALKLGARSDLL